jgi:hypothetical protein
VDTGSGIGASPARTASGPASVSRKRGPSRSPTRSAAPQLSAGQSSSGLSRRQKLPPSGVDDVQASRGVRRSAAATPDTRSGSGCAWAPTRRQASSRNAEGAGPGRATPRRPRPRYPTARSARAPTRAAPGSAQTTVRPNRSRVPARSAVIGRLRRSRFGLGRSGVVVVSTAMAVVISFVSATFVLFLSVLCHHFLSRRLSDAVALGLCISGTLACAGEHSAPKGRFRKFSANMEL